MELKVIDNKTDEFDEDDFNYALSNDYFMKATPEEKSQIINLGTDNFKDARARQLKMINDYKEGDDLDKLIQFEKDKHF